MTLNGSLDTPLPIDDDFSDDDFVSEENNSVAKPNRLHLWFAFSKAVGCFNLQYKEIGNSGGISAATMSNIMSGSRNATWRVWQMAIAGLIDQSCPASLHFWLELPPSVRRSLREHVTHQKIKDFIRDRDFDTEHDRIALELEAERVASFVERIADPEFTRLIRGKFLANNFNDVNPSEFGQLSPESNDTKRGSSVHVGTMKDCSGIVYFQTLSEPQKKAAT